MWWKGCWGLCGQQTLGEAASRATSGGGAALGGAERGGAWPLSGTLSWALLGEGAPARPPNMQESVFLREPAAPARRHWAGTRSNGARRAGVLRGGMGHTVPWGHAGCSLQAVREQKLPSGTCYSADLILMP